MLRFNRFSALLLLVVILALAALRSSIVPQAYGAAPLVKTAPGHILVTAGGKTLYVYALDKQGMSTCTGKCATFWPPLQLIGGDSAGFSSVPGVPGKFGWIMLAQGGDQITYDGRGLYTFAGDKKPGDINGEGVGGVWWAVVVPSK